MPEKHDPDERPEDGLNERERVLNWRLETCLRLRVSVEAAERFAAGDGDLERLRDLIGKGWPPDTAAHAL